jgi:hypothetical protein
VANARPVADTIISAAIVPLVMSSSLLRHQ